MSRGAIEREVLARHLDEYLAASALEDFGPNGLQVEGRSEIRRLVLGVSACLELFEAAVERRADAVLVHHGLFWEATPRVLTGYQRARVAALVRHDVNLFAYHLPLDRHPEVGNNAVAARRLGLVEIEPFGLYRGSAIGCRGRFAEPIGSAELVDRCQRLFGQAPLALRCGPEPLSSVGLISGGGARELHQAIAAGLDAYLTGEPAEWVQNVAREAGIHFLACGHHATERLGVQALGEHLAAEFGLAVEFVDVPNPV